MVDKDKYANLYDWYIQRLKDKEARGLSENDDIHKHHILPKHDGGDPKGELVRCTLRDHARVHYIRWKVYGQE
jgi:hypothetical protein